MKLITVKRHADVDRSVVDQDLGVVVVQTVCSGISEMT